jgi:glycosyltransferase involved in cell wall biosynthesis
MFYKISIIIPINNSEDTITSCTDFVLNQTYNGKVEIYTLITKVIDV